MSHPSSSVSAASTMIRPKLLFLSTEDVAEYSDASKVNISLRDPVIAEDGFKLVYGIRSFGYNTNVMNISQRQGNNVLTIRITYQTPLLTYIDDTTTPVLNTPTTTVEDFQIYISDGNYGTLENLFSEINTQIKKIIPSGWLRDITDAGVTRNIVPFSINFSIQNYNRLIVSIANQDLSVVGGYTILGNDYSAYDFAKLITSITILPSPDQEDLYNLLFTNLTSLSFNKPICLPSFSTKQGMNPPNGISFSIYVDSYDTYDSVNTNNPTFTTDLVNVWNTVEWELTEIGNEHLLDTATGTYPIDNYFEIKSLDYIGYEIPSIHPFYLDISTTLENSNLTTEGLSRNLLTRQFVVGAKDGNNSFFQSWDTPIYYILDSRRISTMEIKFESQKNKWNFFNLEFTLELIVFEIEDEANPADFVEPTFIMPDADTLTATLGQYSSSIQNPYPILGSGQSRKSISYNDILNRRVKRKNN
jgi:hypothetical protein